MKKTPLSNTRKPVGASTATSKVDSSINVIFPNFFVDGFPSV